MAWAFVGLPGMQTRSTYLPPAFSQIKALFTVAELAQAPSARATDISMIPTGAFARFMSFSRKIGAAPMMRGRALLTDQRTPR